MPVQQQVDGSRICESEPLEVPTPKISFKKTDCPRLYRGNESILFSMDGTKSLDDVFIKHFVSWPSILASAFDDEGDEDDDLRRLRQRFDDIAVIDEGKPAVDDEGQFRAQFRVPGFAHIYNLSRFNLGKDDFVAVRL